MPLLGVRNGNLIQNGGFEQGLAFWSGVTNVCLSPRFRAHEGMIAAAMGEGDNTLSSEMHQDVRVLPQTSYKLSFFVAGLDKKPADLTVSITWLCRSHKELGSGLPEPLLIPAESISSAGNGGYRAIVAYTLKTPPQAFLARIKFTKEPGDCDNYVLIDDCVFVEQG
jgi:hypothetical protein